MNQILGTLGVLDIMHVTGTAVCISVPNGRKMKRWEWKVSLRWGRNWWPEEGRRQKEREMTCQLPSHSGILLRISIHRNAPALSLLLSPAHTHTAVTTWGGGGVEVGSSDWLRLSGTAKVSQWETPVSFAAQRSQRHAKEWGLEKSHFCPLTLNQVAKNTYTLLSLSPDFKAPHKVTSQ